MAYKQYNFDIENCKRYKGIRYWKFNEEYVIQFPNNIRVTRYTLKDTKNCINEFLNNSEYTNGWTE